MAVGAAAGTWALRPPGRVLRVCADPNNLPFSIFVYRADAGFEIESFDDPDPRHLRIGVPVVGDDGANPPPAHALAARGIVRNVSGYTAPGAHRLPGAHPAC